MKFTNSIWAAAKFPPFSVTSYVDLQKIEIRYNRSGVRAHFTEENNTLTASLFRQYRLFSSKMAVGCREGLPPFFVGRGTYNQYTGGGEKRPRNKRKPEDRRPNGDLY